MFSKCSQLTYLDVSKWDTSKVTNIYYMFRNCSKLTQLDVSNWDTSNVTNMSAMFISCSSLTQLDVSNWDTGKVTNMGGMFNSTTIKQLKLFKNYNNPIIPDIFLGTHTLTKIDMRH